MLHVELENILTPEELGSRMAEVLERVVTQQQLVVVTRNGQAAAVLLDIHQLEELSGREVHTPGTESSSILPLTPPEAATMPPPVNLEPTPPPVEPPMSPPAAPEMPAMAPTEPASTMPQSMPPSTPPAPPVASMNPGMPTPPPAGAPTAAPTTSSLPPLPDLPNLPEDPTNSSPLS